MRCRRGLTAELERVQPPFHVSMLAASRGMAAEAFAISNVMFCYENRVPEAGGVVKPWGIFYAVARRSTLPRTSCRWACRGCAGSTLSGTHLGSPLDASGGGDGAAVVLHAAAAAGRAGRTLIEVVT